MMTSIVALELNIVFDRLALDKLSGNVRANCPKKELDLETSYRAWSTRGLLTESGRQHANRTQKRSGMLQAVRHMSGNHQAVGPLNRHDHYFGGGFPRFCCLDPSNQIDCTSHARRVFNREFPFPGHTHGAHMAPNIAPKRSLNVRLTSFDSWGTLSFDTFLGIENDKSNPPVLVQPGFPLEALFGNLFAKCSVSAFRVTCLTGCLNPFPPFVSPKVQIEVVPSPSPSFLCSQLLTS